MGEPPVREKETDFTKLECPYLFSAKFLGV
jgi:hypothetical protein